MCNTYNGIVRTSLGPISSKGSQEKAIIEELTSVQAQCCCGPLFPETWLTVLFLFLPLPVRSLTPSPCSIGCLAPYTASLFTTVSHRKTSSGRSQWSWLPANIAIAQRYYHQKSYSTAPFSYTHRILSNSVTLWDFLQQGNNSPSYSLFTPQIKQTSTFAHVWGFGCVSPPPTPFGITPWNEHEEYRLETTTNARNVKTHILKSLITSVVTLTINGKVCFSMERAISFTLLMLVMMFILDLLSP